ncbi:MAG: EAL domain-containing protein [Burkholderiales bacterium]|nr:EAL domain-containing protein [Burkholderiales bacterium]
MSPVPVPAPAGPRALLQALATAIAVDGAAALSRAPAFGDGALMLMWLPTSVALVALVAVLAGGPRLAVSAALGIAAWAAERGAGAAAMAIARQQARADPERYRRLPLSAPPVEHDRGGLRAMRSVRDAVREGRLRRLGQPIVRADGTRGRLHDEVPSRLVDEAGREIPPAAFLALLARIGMSQAFDRQVVARTLERQGRDAAPRGCTATCAINPTGPTVADPGFPAFPFGRLAATGVAPRTIELEITESDPITGIEGAMRNTEVLVRGGLGFAPDRVKIDGPLERQIVDSIVRVARAAGAPTVAECVETPAALERMRELGVDAAQGWGIVRPMPMRTLVAVHRHGAAAVVPAGDPVPATGRAPRLTRTAARPTTGRNRAGRRRRGRGSAAGASRGTRRRPRARRPSGRAPGSRGCRRGARASGRRPPPFATASAARARPTPARRCPRSPGRARARPATGPRARAAI